MSDNIHWLDNGQRSLQPEEPVTPTGVEAGGGGPHDPGMGPRVAALEADMKDVKAGISRLETSFAVVQATVASLATKAELATVNGRLDTLTGRVEAQGKTLDDVKVGIRDLGAKVDAKLISGAQMFAIFGGLMALFITLGGSIIGLLHYLGWLH